MSIQIMQSDKHGISTRVSISLLSLTLNEYYEMVGDSRPLSGFLPTHADLFYRNAFIIMELSNPPSFRAIRAVIASQSTFEI